MDCAFSNLVLSFLALACYESLLLGGAQTPVFQGEFECTKAAFLVAQQVSCPLSPLISSVMLCLERTVGS